MEQFDAQSVSLNLRGLADTGAKLHRIQHHQVVVNDTQPMTGPSTISQEHTAILAALTIKKPTLNTQLTLLQWHTALAMPYESMTYALNCRTRVPHPQIPQGVTSQHSVSWEILSTKIT